jgi:hypothetical protein
MSESDDTQGAIQASFVRCYGGNERTQAFRIEDPLRPNKRFIQSDVVAEVRR